MKNNKFFLTTLFAAAALAVAPNVPVEATDYSSSTTISEDTQDSDSASTVSGSGTTITIEEGVELLLSGETTLTKSDAYTQDFTGAGTLTINGTVKTSGNNAGTLRFSVDNLYIYSLYLYDSSQTVEFASANAEITTIAIDWKSTLNFTAGTTKITTANLWAKDWGGTQYVNISDGATVEIGTLSHKNPNRTCNLIITNNGTLTIETFTTVSSSWSPTATLAGSGTTTITTITHENSGQELKNTGILSVLGTITTVSGATFTNSGTMTYSGTSIVNTGTFTNSGTLTITSSSAIISGDGTFTSTGTLIVDSGMSLELSSDATLSGTIENAGTFTLSGTIEFSSAISNSGTVVISDTATIILTEDLITYSDDGTSGTYTFVTGSGTVSGLTESNLDFSNLGSVSTVTINSDGSVTFTLGAASDLVWDNDFSSGTWNMSNSLWKNGEDSVSFSNFDNVTFDGATATVTLGSDVKVGTMTVTGDSSVTISSTNSITGTTLTIDPGSTLQIGSSSSNSVSLDFEEIYLGGQLSWRNGSGYTISSLTFTDSGAKLYLNSVGSAGTLTISSLAVEEEADATVSWNWGSTLAISSLTGSGDLSFTGSAQGETVTLTLLSISGYSGTLSFSASDGGTFTTTISTTGTSKSVSFVVTDGALVNFSYVSSSGSYFNEATISGSGSTVQLGNWTGNFYFNKVTLTDGGTLKLYNGNSTGGYTIGGSGSQIVIDGTGTISGSYAGGNTQLTSSISGNGTLSLTPYATSGTSYYTISGTISDGDEEGDSLALAVSTTLYITGTNTYSGGTTITAGVLYVESSSSALGTGAISLTGGTLRITSSASLTNEITSYSGSSLYVVGTLTTQGSSSLAGTTTVSGTLTNSETLTNSGTLTISGTLKNSEDANLTLSGTTTVSGTMTNSGTLTNTGTLTVSGTLTNSEDATLTLSGTVTLSSAIENSGTVTVDSSVSFLLASLDATSSTSTSTTYTLISGGTVVSWSELSLENFSDVVSFLGDVSAVDVSTDGVVTFTYSETVADLTWSTDFTSGTWNTTDTYWLNESDELTNFSGRSNVKFVNSETTIVTLEASARIMVGTMTVAEDASLKLTTTGTYSASTGATISGTTLTIESGATLYLGTGESYLINLDFDEILLSGKLQYQNGPNTTFNSLTFAEEGAELYLYAMGTSGTDQKLTISSAIVSANATISAYWGGNLTITNLSGSADLKYSSSTYSANASNVLTITDVSEYTGTLSVVKATGSVSLTISTLSGSGNFYVENGTFTISEVSDYTGTITLDSSMVIVSATTAAITLTIPSLNVSGTTTIKGDNSANTYQSAFTISSLSGSGTLNFSNGARSAGASVFTISGGDGFSGTINVNELSNNGVANTRRVALVISDETVAQDAAINFVTSNTNISSAMVLGVNASNVKIAGLSSTSGKTVYVLSGSVSLGATSFSSDSTARTLEITGSNAYTFYGTILENVNIVMSGEGMQTFAGESADFNGTVTVYSGTLGVANSAAFGSSGTISLEGGVLEIDSEVELTNAVTIVLDSYENSTEKILTGSGTVSEIVLSVSDSASYTGGIYYVSTDLSISETTLSYEALTALGYDVVYDEDLGTITVTSSEFSELYWNGTDEENSWTNDSTVTNWHDENSVSRAFRSGIAVFFDDTAENKTVVIAEAISAGAVTVSADYEFSFDSGTLTATTLEVQENATLTASGTGTITVSALSGAGTIALTNADGDGELTFSFSQTARVTAADLTISVGSGTTLVVGSNYYGLDIKEIVLAGGTLSSGTTLGYYDFWSPNIRLTADSTIDTETSSTLYTLIQYDSSAFSYSTTSLDLAGNTLTKTGAGGVSLYNTEISAGTIVIEEGSLTLQASSGTVSAEETSFEIAEGASLFAAGNNSTNGDSTVGDITNAGTLQLNSAATTAGMLTVSGTLTNTGTINIAGSSATLAALTVSGTLDSSGTITNAGTLTIAGSATISGTLNSTGTIAVSENATLTLAGTTTLSSAIENSGTVTVDTSSVVFELGNITADDDGTYVLISGGTIENWESLTVDNFLVSGTIISGRSTLDLDTSGAVTITGGTVANLTWTNDSGDGLWNVQSSSNWLNASTSAADQFYTLDNVKFTNSYTNSVTLAENITAGNVTISGTAPTVSFATQDDGNGGYYSLTVGTITIGADGNSNITIGENLVVNAESVVRTSGYHDWTINGTLNISGDWAYGDSSAGNSHTIGGTGTINVGGNMAFYGNSGCAVTLTVSKVNITGALTFTGYSTLSELKQVTIGDGSSVTIVNASTLGFTYATNGLRIYANSELNITSTDTESTVITRNKTQVNITANGTLNVAGAIIWNSGKTASFSGTGTVNLLSFKESGSAATTFSVANLNISGTFAVNGSASFYFTGTNANITTYNVNTTGSTLYLTDDDSAATNLTIGTYRAAWGSSISISAKSTLTVTTMNLWSGGAMSITGDSGTLNATSLGVGNNAVATISGINLNVGSGGINNTTGGSTWTYTLNFGDALTVGVYAGTDEDDPTTSWSSALNIGLTGTSTGTTFDLDEDEQITLSGVLSGSGILNKSGAGTLLLSGANTFTGGTTISAGTLQAANSSALGVGDLTIESEGTLLVSSGTTLEVTGTATVAGTLDLSASSSAISISEDLELTGTLETVYSASSSAAVSVSGTLTVDSSTSFVVYEIPEISGTDQVVIYLVEASEVEGISSLSSTNVTLVSDTELPDEYSLSFSYVDGNLILTYSLGDGILTWQDVGDSWMDGDWIYGNKTDKAFEDGLSARFASGYTNDVTISSAVEANNLYVEASAQFIFEDDVTLTAAGTLKISEDATLTLSGAGTLVVAFENLDVAGTIVISDDAILDLGATSENAVDLSYISGTGTLVLTNESTSPTLALADFTGTLKYSGDLDWDDSEVAALTIYFSAGTIAGTTLEISSETTIYVGTDETISTVLDFEKISLSGTLVYQSSPDNASWNELEFAAEGAELRFYAMGEDGTSQSVEIASVVVSENASISAYWGGNLTISELSGTANLEISVPESASYSPTMAVEIEDASGFTGTLALSDEDQDSGSGSLSVTISGATNSEMSVDVGAGTTLILGNDEISLGSLASSGTIKFTNSSSTLTIEDEATISGIFYIGANTLTVSGTTLDLTGVTSTAYISSSENSYAGILIIDDSTVKMSTYAHGWNGRTTNFGSNMYSSNLIIKNGGVLEIVSALTNADADGTERGFTISGAGTYRFSGTGTSYIAANSSSDNTNIVLEEDAILTFDVVDADAILSVSKVIEEEDSTSGALVKIGAGTLVLSGTNSYSGGTTISAGTLEVGNSAALGSGTVTLAGGTLSGSDSETITLSGTNFDVQVSSTISNLVLAGTSFVYAEDVSISLASSTTFSGTTSVDISTFTLSEDAIVLFSDYDSSVDLDSDSWTILYDGYELTGTVSVSGTDIIFKASDNDLGRYGLLNWNTEDASSVWDESNFQSKTYTGTTNSFTFSSGAGENYTAEISGEVGANKINVESGEFTFTGTTDDAKISATLLTLAAEASLALENLAAEIETLELAGTLSLSSATAQVDALALEDSAKISGTSSSLEVETLSGTADLALSGTTGDEDGFSVSLASISEFSGTITASGSVEISLGNADFEESSAKIVVSEGATLVLGNDANFTLELAGGTLEYTQTNAFTPNISLSENSEIYVGEGVVSGLIQTNSSGEFEQTSLDLAGSTLTISGAGTFFVENAEISSGAIDVSAGTTLQIGSTENSTGTTTIAATVTAFEDSSLKIYEDTELSGKIVVLEGAALEISADSTLTVSGTLQLEEDSAFAGTLKLVDGGEIYTSGNLTSGFVVENSGTASKFTYSAEEDGELSGDEISLSGTLVFDVEESGATLSVSKNISGTATSSLEKKGSGTLVLSGTNVYGDTTVSKGTLEVASSSAFGTGALTLSENTTLILDEGVEITLSGTSTLETSTIVLSENSSISVSENAEIVISGTITFDLAEAFLSFEANSDGGKTATVTIFESGVSVDSSVSLSDFADILLISGTSISEFTHYGNVTFSEENGALVLSIDWISAEVYWTGEEDGVLTTNTVGNFEDGEFYEDGDIVIFDGEKVVTSEIELGNDVVDVGIVVQNCAEIEIAASEDFTITGTSSISVDENSSLTLLGVDFDFTGTTSVDGTLTLNFTDSDATYASEISGSGTVIFDIEDGVEISASENLAVGTTLSGDVSLEKTGAGTLVLDEVQDYSGSTTVSAGTLVIAVDGELGNGEIAIAGSATLELVYESGTYDFAGTVSGEGDLVISGTGTDETFIEASASDFALTGTTTLDEATLVVSADDDVEFSTVISGTGTIEKSGSGTLTLADGSDISIDLQEGGIANVTISEDSTLTAASGTTIEDLTLEGTLDLSENAGSVTLSGDNELSGTLVVGDGLTTDSVTKQEDEEGNVSFVVNSGTASIVVSSGTTTVSSDLTIDLTDTFLATVLSSKDVYDGNGDIIYTTTYYIVAEDGGTLEGWENISLENITVNGVAISELYSRAEVVVQQDGTITFYNTVLNLVWDSEITAGVWTTADGNENWEHAGSNFGYYNGDIVTFASNAEVTLGEDVLPAYIYVSAGTTEILASEYKISGTTGVEIASGANLILNSAHDFTGTAIVEGTLTLNISEDILNSGTAMLTSDISGSGTLVLNAGQNDFVYEEVLTNSISDFTGTIQKSGSGTMTISENHDDLASSLTFRVAAGTLKIDEDGTLGNAQIVVSSNAILEIFNDSDSTKTVENKISATGTILKTGSGTAELTGDVSGSGTLEVAEGTILVSEVSSLKITNVEIDEDAELKITGAGTTAFGNLVGTGTLTVDVGSGNSLTLSNDFESDFAGTISVASGTLVAQVSQLSSEEIILEDDTTLSLSLNSGTQKFSETVTGTGTIALSETTNSTLVLDGDLSEFAGTIATGTSATLEVTSGTALGSELATVENESELVLSASSDFGEVVSKLSGAGTIYKTGSGTATISNAENDFTGTIYVTAGTLVFDEIASLGDASNAVVSSSATLEIDFSGTKNSLGTEISGDGAVKIKGTSGNVDSDGFSTDKIKLTEVNTFSGGFSVESAYIVTEANSLGQTSAGEGDVYLTTNSTWEARNGFDTTSGTTITLVDNSRLITTSSTGTTSGDFYAEAGTGTVTISNLSVSVDTNGATSIYIDLNNKSYATDSGSIFISGTEGTSISLDGVSVYIVIDDISLLEDFNLVYTLGELTGTPTIYLNDEEKEDWYSNGRITVDSVSNNVNLAYSSMIVIPTDEFIQDSETIHNRLEQRRFAAAYGDEEWEFFAQVQTTSHNSGKENDSKNFDYSSYGALVAADIKLGSSTVLGVGVATDHADAKIHDDQGKIKSDSYRALVFASQLLGDYIFVEGGVEYGISSFDIYREGTSGTSRGSTDGTSVGGFANLGCVIPLSTSFSVLPYVGATYVYTKVDDFTESGTVNYDAEGFDATSIRGKVGARLRYDFAPGMAFTVGAAYSHEFGDTEVEFSVKNSSAGQYSLRSENAFTKDLVTGYIGAEFGLSSAAALFFGYNVDFGFNSEISHHAHVGFKVSF